MTMRTLHTLRGRAHRPEGGFTLVEMIIVLVLLALAMGAIFPALSNMTRSSNRRAAATQSFGEARVAALLLEQDVRTAEANRSTGDRSDAHLFNAATASSLSTVGALGALDPQRSDIVIAGPLQLVVNADVLSTVPGPERVEWRLIENSPECGDTNNAGNNWCIRRSVRAQSAVLTGGATLTTEIIVRGRGTAPLSSTCWDTAPAARRIFCYQEAAPQSGIYDWDGGWTRACNEAYLVDAQSPNLATLQLTTRTYTLSHNGAEPTTRISRLDRITEVGATLYAGGAYGNAAERSYENVTVSIRSRENEAYQEAIMCGRRAGWGQ